MSQTKAQLLSGTTAQDLTVDNINTTSINSGQTSGRKNLIINGAMQVAQRGTSSTSGGYQTVDRFTVGNSGTDETPTQAQVDVAAGTTPYTLGFRKAFKLTNGNQTGGAGASDFIFIKYVVEAQDTATSGWNFKSASSDITLSFWAKSSVAQNFFGYIEMPDSPEQVFPFQTGSLSADTWTKITVTIPGNSNIVVNNDNGEGLKIFFSQFWGTDFTDSGRALNTWAAFNSGQRMPDFTSTWYTTNDATFELTGVQLEVGSTATDFEHRSFGEELSLCHRYFYLVGSQARDGNPSYTLGLGALNTATSAFMHFPFPTEMRATPTLEHTNGADYYRFFNNGGGVNLDGAFTIWNPTLVQSFASCTLDGSLTSGGAVFGVFNDNSAKLGFTAEL